MPGKQICAVCVDRMVSQPLVYRPPRDGAPATFALGPYCGVLRSIILNVKFRHRYDAAIILGKTLGAKLPRLFEAIVPVPLHSKRLLDRGFNQADAIAGGIAAVLGAPVVRKALLRPRATQPQSSLALRDRHVNTFDAFAAGAQLQGLHGRHVLLVDDVLTTGATLAACAVVLWRDGVTRITGAALAIKL